MICAGCHAVVGTENDVVVACPLCGQTNVAPPDDSVEAAEAVNGLVEAVRKWDPMVSLDGMGPTVEGAVWLAARVRDAIESLRLADATLTEFVAGILPSRTPYEVDGVGAARIEYGSDRKEWDSSGLTAAAVAAICDGDVDEIGRVRPIIDAFLTFARPDWRVTPFKDRGLAVDEYCTKTPGRARLIIE